MRTGAGTLAAFCVASVVTAAIAPPVVLSPTEQICGVEIVGPSTSSCCRADPPWSMIILTSLLMATSERVTITLPAATVAEIDHLARNRSRFVAEAVERELARRRRQALLESIRNPHSETTEVADTGLADWAAGLPDDEGLVDLEGGTAVRWIEGMGWVEDKP